MPDIDPTDVRDLTAAEIEGRQMMCCAVTGQGAGIAAAVSIKNKVPCSRVNIAEVQIILKKQGVRID